MRLPTTLLSLMLLATVSVCARSGDPYSGLTVIEQHSLEALGTGGNLVVVEDTRGRLYAGNDHILEYDGSRWSVIPVGDGNSVRDLLVDDANRIWCGAVNDLGYLEEDASGARRFRSLRQHLSSDLTSFQVWGVHRHSAKTLFVCDDSVLIWDGTRFERHTMPVERRLFSFEFEGNTYISQPGTGLWRWDGERLEGVGLGGLEKSTIQGAWRDLHGSTVFLANDFLVRSGPEGAEAFAHETLAEIRPTRLVSTLRLPDGTVAVSSFTSGIFLLDSDGAIIRHLDRSAGLPSNVCFRATPDRHGRVWVGLDYHVVGFDSRNVQTLFTGSNGGGGEAVGVVHSATTGTLMATTELVARVGPSDRSGAALERLPYLTGRITDIVSLADGTIIAAGMRQFLRLTADNAESLVETERDFAQVVQVDPLRQRLAAAEWDQVALLDLEAIPIRQGKIDGFAGTFTRLGIDKRNTLWVALRRDGVYSVQDVAAQAQIKRHLVPGRELPKPFEDPALFMLGGDAYAFTANAVVALPRESAGEPHLVLEGMGLLAAERSGSASVWAVAAKADREPRLVRVSSTAGGEPAARVSDQSIRGIGNITVTCLTEDHILWIGGTKGFIRIDAREVGDEPAPQAPIVQAVSWRAGEQVTRLPLAGGPTVDFARTGTIEFQLRDSGDPFAPTQLIETRLAGTGADWRLTGKSCSIAGLDEGRYTLEARVVGFLGNPGPVVSYSFTITPPWFRTPLAYASYVLLFGGSLFGAAQWRTRRIRRQNAQLEQIVNRRTEELAKAVSARSAFLANMGHEIRNPLNGVVGLVDTLRARELAPEQKGIVDRIGTCADQLISVIEDVLEYARIDAGRITLRTRAFAVREPVEACIDIFRAAQPTAVIELEADPAELDSQVQADPDRIRHILVNYLANALKFGGGTPVTVGVRREGALLIFSVRDRGPGLSAEEQARLFVRFSRGSLAYKNAIPGTGLGLAACKAYAEAMGGDVSVESEPGQGATFFLRIPYQPAAATETVAGPAPTELLLGRKALVVDDQDFNRFVLADLLGRMGATAVQAASVEEAREAFRARVPDIVFVDFDLSGATGADLADWIRKEAPAGRDVPIVATTAFEVDEVRRRCEEAAMDGFLSKPVTAQRLNEVVARIESVRSGGQSPIVPTSSTAAAPVSSFLDILAGGDPARRMELERSTWGEVLTEALATHRALRRDDAPIAARHAHRLVSAALILGHREIVTTARELNGLAKAGDLPAARETAMRLRRHIRALRPRQTR